MNFDVVIVGAGLIGLSLAKALDQAGITVALVEQRPLHIALPNTYSNRVSAITHASQQWLEQIGAWQHISAFSCAYHSMFVYDGEGTGNIEFESNEVPCDNLGSIVENIRIIDALNNVPSNIELFESCKVTSFSEVNTQGLREVTLDNGLVLSCELIVGADSKQSTIRKKAMLDTHTWSYNQSATVATVQIKKPNNSPNYSNKTNKTCWQNFTYCGPLAFLPLYDLEQQDTTIQSYSIVWSVDDDQYDEFASKALIEQLNLHKPSNIGDIISVEDQAQFPLSALHCNQYTKAGIAIIGDAAHSIHPLAGQGANLGFGDAKKLYDVLTQAKKHNVNLGNAVILKRYERERKLQNRIMQTAMEGFKRGFEGQNPIQVLLRNQAMHLTAHPLFPKAWVMKRALG